MPNIDFNSRIPLDGIKVFVVNREDGLREGYTTAEEAESAALRMVRETPQYKVITFESIKVYQQDPKPPVLMKPTNKLATPQKRLPGWSVVDG